MAVWPTRVSQAMSDTVPGWALAAVSGDVWGVLFDVGSG